MLDRYTVHNMLDEAFSEGSPRLTSVLDALESDGEFAKRECARWVKENRKYLSPEIADRYFPVCRDVHDEIDDLLHDLETGDLTDQNRERLEAAVTKNRFGY